MSVQPRVARGATLALVLVALAALALRERAPEPAAPVGSDARPETQGEGPAPERSVARSTAGETAGATARPVEPLPRSLRGSEVDGGVTVGPRGELVVGRSLRRLFDYFLSASGEEPEAALRARVLAELRARAPEPAASEASALFDRYLAYRERLASIVSPGASSDPERALDEIRRLQRETFGADAERFFGDDRETEVAIALARLRKDDRLSPAEREVESAALEASLPAPVREARAASMAPLVTAAEEAELRAASATEEDVHAYRAATIGPSAADRLAELDRSRAAWRARVDDFLRAREDLARTRASASEREAAERALLEASFSAPERVRVDAILRSR